MPRVTMGVMATLELSSPYLMELDLAVGLGPTQFVLGPQAGQAPFSLAEVVSGLGTMLKIPALAQIGSLASDPPWSAIFGVRIAPSLTVTVGSASGPANSVQLIFKLYDSSGDYGITLGGTVGGVFTIAPSFTVYDLIVGYESGKGLDVRARVHFEDQAASTQLTAGADPPAGKTQVVSYPFPLPPTGGKNFQVKYLGLGQRFGPPPYTGSGDPLAAIFDQLEKTFTSNDPATVLGGLAEYYDPARGWFIGAHLCLRGWEIRALFNDPSVYGLEVNCTVDLFAGLSFEILYQKLGPHLGVYYGALTLPDKFRQINVGAVALTLPSFRIWIYTNGDFKVSVGWPLGPDSISVQASIFTGGGGFYFAKLRSGDNPQSGQAQLASMSAGGGTSLTSPTATQVQQYNPIIEFGLALVLGVGRSFSQGPFSASLSLTLQGVFQGILAWNAPDDDPSKSASISRAPDYFWFAATVSLVGQLQGSVDLVIIQISVMVRLSVSASVAFETGYGTVVGVEARVDVEASVHFLFFSVSVGFHATVSQTFRVSSGANGDASITGPQNPAFKGMNDWTAAPRLLAEMAAARVPALSLYPEPASGDAALASLAATAAATGVAVNLHFILQPTVTYAGGSGTVTAVATLAIPSPGPATAGTTTDLERLLAGLAGWLLTTYALQTGKWPEVAAALGAGSDPPPAGFETALNGYLEANVAFTLTGVDGTQPPPANAVSAAVFPMFAGLQMSWTGGGAPLPFASRTTPADYAQVVADYFAELSIQGLVSVTEDAAPKAAAPAETSLAEFVFTDWFVLVCRQMAKELADGGGTGGLPDAGVATNVGGMVSRFMLNGLRLPDPATVPAAPPVDLTKLSIAPGYALSGQQFAVPDATQPCSATLSLAPGAGSPAGSIRFAVGTSVTSIMPVETAPPEPAPVWSSGTLPAAANAQAAITPLPPVQSQPLWFAQRTRLPWARPDGTTPVVVPLPPGVLQAAAAGPAALTVQDAPPAATPGGNPAPLAATPALTIASRVTRVPVARTGGVTQSATPAATYVPNVYAVLGTDDDTRARIDALLAQPASALAGAVLSVLYNAPTTGYRSDAPNATLPVLLAKTNLSTTTAPALATNTFLFRAAAPPDPLGPTSAPLSDAADFLRLLWEVSVVHSSGFFLQYADAQGNGLPDGVFSGDTADLTFLLTFPPAATAPVAQPWHNALTVASALTGSLFIAVADANGNQLLAWSPSYPTGCIGFVIDWSEQTARLTSGAPGAAYDPEWVAHLYHLIQFQVAEVQGAFEPSLWSLALSPSTDSSGEEPGTAPGAAGAADQNYRQIVPIYAFASTNGGQQPGVYAAVGSTAQLTFRVNDVFGNALDDATHTAPFPVLYTDPLITPGEWPGVRSGYGFAATPSPSLSVAMEFRPDFLAGGASPPPATITDNANAALLRYRTIVAQMQDANTQLALSTTVLPSNGGVVGSGPAMRAQLATFATSIAAALAGIAQSGSIAGVGPIDCTLSAPIAPADLANRTDDVFQVLTSLTFSRLATLVDADAARRLPSIQLATQSVAAQLDAGSSVSTGTGDPPSVTLTAFARAFEATFQGFDGKTGTAKLAVRSDAAGAGASSPTADTLWAVRWSPTAGIQAAFTDPKAAYFTLAPLSTRPLNGTATVDSYDPNLNPVRTTPTLTAVDLDAWAAGFLGTFDGVLSPATAVALAQLAPDAFHQLMAAKAQLAAAVTGGVVPVFQPSPELAAGDAGEASDRFEQTLLASLASAYAISAVVQVPAAVSVAGTAESGAQVPPRFFGSVGTADASPPTGAAYTASTAKLVARTSTPEAPQYLTFVVSATSPGDETDLPLALKFQVRFMEHRIDQADADFGYVPSEWLRFVLPEPALDLTLQPVDVPVPGRGIPPNPVLQQQTAAQSAVTVKGTGPLGGVLEWDYVLALRLDQLEAQDDLWLNADYNLPLASPQAGVQGQAPVPPPVPGKLGPLFSALASFNASWPVLGPLVAGLPATAHGSPPAGPPAATVVAALVARVQAVADAWTALWAPQMELSLDLAPALPQTDTFVFRFKELEQGTVEVFGLADGSGPNGLTWPTLDGKTYSTAPAPLSSAVPPPGPGTQWFVATYPFAAQAGSSAALSIDFAEMDVLARQTARAECWRVRNATLSSNPRLVANPALVYQTPVVGFSDPVVPLLVAPPVGPFPSAGTLSATLGPVLEQIAGAGSATQEPRTLKVSVSYRYPLATAPDGTSVMADTAVLLADGISLATGGAAAIAAELAGAVDTWQAAVQPVTPKGAILNLAYVVFANIDGARLPLIQLPQVQYAVPAPGWWTPE